jgi:hypothetical protein
MTGSTKWLTLFHLNTEAVSWPGYGVRIPRLSSLSAGSYTVPDYAFDCIDVTYQDAQTLCSQDDEFAYSFMVVFGTDAQSA